MSIFGFSRKFRAAKRLKEIANVFIRHGFGNLVDQIHLGKYVSIAGRLKSFGSWPSLIKGPNAPERFRLAFEELGPSFIKFAQILSTRPDLIPPSFADEFERLQDRVPPFAFESAKGILEESLGEPLERVFKQFERVPIAAASIAQVHRAVLMDGTKVIVKVQRPDIRKTIEADIDILYNVASLLEAYVPDSRYINPKGIVAEFERTVNREMDFAQEARNCQRMRKNFKSVQGVHIPEPFFDFSTDKVLVLERMNGVRIDDIDAIVAMEADPKLVATHALDAYFKMVFVDGFFHGDPHPGNIIAMKDSSVGFMDFGIMGRINDDTRAILSSTLAALANKDYESLVDLCIMLGLVPEDRDLDTFKVGFQADLRDLLDPMYDTPLKEIDFAYYLDQIISIAIKHKIKIPADLILLDKVVMMLESIVTKLNPDIDIISAMKPYMSHIAFEGLNPGKAMDETIKSMKEIGQFMRYFPKQVKKILWKVIRDEIVVKLSLKGLDTLTKDIDRSSNRISVAMIISAILISSAIMHATKVGPIVYGMSVMGFMVFGFAAVLGIALIISIIRSGRLLYPAHSHAIITNVHQTFSMDN